MSNVQVAAQSGVSESIQGWIEQLKKGEPDQARRAADRLRALGVEAVTPLLESLGNRKPLTVLLDPLFRRFDRPGRLSFQPPEKLFNERVEAILAGIGPAALPQLAQGLDHPDFRVREAAARLMARQDRAAVPYLIEAMHKPRAKYLPGDALVSVGKPAIQPLVDFLKRERAATPVWDAADAALCAMIKSPTRKAIQHKRQHLLWSWILALAGALLAFGVGLWAEIGAGPSAILGLVVGYALWVAVLHESNGAQNNDTADILIFLLECVTAPFVYKEKLAAYRSSQATRARLAQKYGLPA